MTEPQIFEPGPRAAEAPVAPSTPAPPVQETVLSEISPCMPRLYLDGPAGDVAGEGEAG